MNLKKINYNFANGGHALYAQFFLLTNKYMSFENAGQYKFVLFIKHFTFIMHNLNYLRNFPFVCSIIIMNATINNDNPRTNFVYVKL